MDGADTVLIALINEYLYMVLAVIPSDALTAPCRLFEANWGLSIHPAVGRYDPCCGGVGGTKR